MNLNDGTVEGFRHRDLPVISVQYHPEASPGPHDSHYLFDDFVKLMRSTAGAADGRRLDMPRDPSIKSVLVIGSGPIVIGQACEFDYSGTQAIKVLRTEGIRVSLVNSNPATIMTDPEYADRTYVEPLTPEVLETILERERPDAVLPTVGGQTALNLAVELSRRGRARPAGHPPHRRQPPRGRDGRGPPALQGGDGPHRPRRAEERLRPAPSRRRARCWS